MKLLKLKIDNLYFFIPFLIILFPLFPSLLKGYLGQQIIFLITFIFIFWGGMAGIYKPTISNISFILFSYFFIVTISSLLFDIKNNYLIISDTFEILKPISFLFSYIFYRYSNININKIEKNTISLLLIVFFIQAIYCILELALPAIIKPISNLLYRREKFESLTLTNVFIGTYHTTYSLAFILLLPIIYTLVSFLRNFKLNMFLLFLIYLFTFLLTQSKNMYLTFGITLIIILCMPSLYKNIKSSFLILFIFITLIIIFAYIYNIYHDQIILLLNYSINGIKNIFSGQNRSFNIRKNQLFWTFENNNLILIGAGISKGIIMLESFYSLYYYRYGVLGIFFYFLMLFHVFQTAYKISEIEYKKNIIISNFYLSIAIFFLITPFGILNSTNQDNPKTAFLFYGLIGLVYNKYQNIKNSKI